MITDDVFISMGDGSRIAAMEVRPGRKILSFKDSRLMLAEVLQQKVEMGKDAIGLVLSSGQRLCGSRDQKVAVFKEKIIRFRPLSEVETGDRLSGERAGMPTTVNVVGLITNHEKEVRFVGFTLDHDKSFVAEGVVCR